jgi:Xaa-Pro aminopeptidase
MTEYRGRIDRLQQQLREEGAGGALLAGTDQMLYLTGWKEGGHERFVGLFVPSAGEPSFVVPAMNADQARHTPAEISHVIGWDDATGWHDAVRNTLASWGDRPRILVDDELRSDHLLSLQKLRPDASFGVVGPVITRLREVKTAEELRSMEHAAGMIDEVFLSVAEQLAAGLTELEVADLVLAEIKVRGSVPSFRPLICFGANSAHPHHHTGSSALKLGDVVIIDIGCVVDGYASDITRTVAFGEPSDSEAHQIYSIVLHAHKAAREAARPGVSGESVDAVARGVITDAGYGEQFLHRTGHGIGLSVHEPPNIVKGNAGLLQPGMCFSVEPGIYLPGRFGVRIENIVTVTENGVRSLNAEPDDNLRELRIHY